MMLSSLFSRTSAQDLHVQVRNNCERQTAKIVHTINNEDRGVYQFEITRQRVERSADTSTNIHLRGQAMLEAEEALRRSVAYAQLHDICKDPTNNCQIEYSSEYLRDKKAVVAYVVIDTRKPYSAPHLPIGLAAAPSTIFHNQYTDDEVTQYDEDGIPMPPSMYTAEDDSDDDIGAEHAAIELSPAITHITAPKVTFKRATA